MTKTERRDARDLPSIRAPEPTAPHAQVPSRPYRDDELQARARLDDSTGLQVSMHVGVLVPMARAAAFFERMADVFYTAARFNEAWALALALDDAPPAPTPPTPLADPFADTVPTPLAPPAPRVPDDPRKLRLPPTDAVLEGPMPAPEPPEPPELPAPLWTTKRAADWRIGEAATVVESQSFGWEHDVWVDVPVVLHLPDPTTPGFWFVRHATRRASFTRVHESWLRRVPSSRI